MAMVFMAFHNTTIKKLIRFSTLHLIKYAHGFVVICFDYIIDFVGDSLTHILRDYFCFFFQFMWQSHEYN